MSLLKLVYKKWRHILFPLALLTGLLQWSELVLLSYTLESPTWQGPEGDLQLTSREKLRPQSNNLRGTECWQQLLSELRNTSEETVATANIVIAALWESLSQKTQLIHAWIPDSYILWDRFKGVMCYCICQDSPEKESQWVCVWVCVCGHIHNMCLYICREREKFLLKNWLFNWLDKTHLHSNLLYAKFTHFNIVIQKTPL